MKNRSKVGFGLLIVLGMVACSGEGLLRQGTESQKATPEQPSVSSAARWLKQSEPTNPAPEKLNFGVGFISSGAASTSKSPAPASGKDAVQSTKLQMGSGTIQADEVDLTEMLGNPDDFEQEIFSPTVEDKETSEQQSEVQDVSKGDDGTKYTVEDAMSMYNLGYKAQAVELLQRLHQAGNAEASHELGIYYYNMGEVDNAASDARKYLLVAAEAKDYQYSGQALYQAALLSLREKDYREALSLASVASDERGEGAAFSLVLDLLKSRQGFDPQDERQTKSSWFKRGKKNGQLGQFYHLYLAQHPELNAGEREVMRETVRQQYTLGAEKGKPYQQYCLARAYLEGDLFERNVINVGKARSLLASAYNEVYPNQRVYRENYSKDFVVDLINLHATLDEID